ncbi:MAG: ABC transporter substrate-binding protein [Ruminococcaceae bacterium]|nr:ABC transporter substrate-binding protein [Oscillospiraceae bacterium]
MKKIISLILAAIMLFALCACGAADAPAPATSPEVTPEPVSPAVSGSDIPEDDKASEEPQLSNEPINIMVLNGTTGFGMAKLMSDFSAGLSPLNYNISVETDASNITAALINGSTDIAALPTNAASVVYNKTGGEVQLLALNTLGVLYVVVNSEKESISSLAQLEGKTVFTPAQNPSFIMDYICKNAGVNVTIDTSFAQPADLRTAVAAGEVDIAVLPEPMVTIARAANDKLAVALDLTEEWAKINDSQLVQGCLVVRREFAEAHPAAIAAFLEEYEASINFLSEDTAAAAQMIVEAGIFAQAPVAQKAIPNCNLCFIDGSDMIAPMEGFLEAMFSVAPPSIGGAVPADDFYYLG